MIAYISAYTLSFLLGTSNTKPFVPTVATVGFTDSATPNRGKAGGKGIPQCTPRVSPRELARPHQRGKWEDIYMKTKY